MLDPAKPRPLNLSSLDSYLSSCLALAQERLADFSSVEEVAEAEAELNCYPRLEVLEDPRAVFVADERSLSAQDIARAAESLLAVRVLLEHACAGEATRLGLGAKYLLNPRQDFVGETWERLRGEGLVHETKPEQLKPLSLGRRHMLQLAWDLWRLAEEMGVEPAQALANQHLLVIVNQASAQDVLEDFRQANFYGFRRAQTMFMVQASFPGLHVRDGRWTIDRNSRPRLHNHGQMLMQTTMEGQIFRLDPRGRRLSLPWSEFSRVLQGLEDKVSFNIEDLDYLSQSLDLTGLAAALKLGDGGARMVMEVVSNNPQAPIKGGACCYDPVLGRNVMIESFQLRGLAPGDIAFLNKNINHYPQPLAALAAVRERGLSMPLTVKDSRLYFQPVQGDLNFLLSTAFLRRGRLKPIRAWKSLVDTPAALTAMSRQDARPGFLTWAASLTGLQV